MLHYTKIGIIAASLSSALATSQAAWAMDILCPANTTATWNQAANGRTNTIQGGLAPISASLPGPPLTTLTCQMSGFVPPNIQQTVQFAPNTVVSACGAQATFTGQARFVGIAPFGGVTFKSKRQRATPSYNQQTGVCRLTIPLIPLALSVRMSASCEGLSDRFRCPDNAVPIGN